MDMLTYRLALSHYGISIDPFSAGLSQATYMDTDDMQRCRTAIVRTAIERTITVITAPAGAGKTTIIGSAVQKLGKNAHVICTGIMEAERMSIRDIIADIVSGITEDDGVRIPRDAPRRERLVARTLGQVPEQRPVIVIIDEAHLISPYTLRSIKRLWNLQYKGRSPLLGIALVGQPGLIARVGNIWELDGRSEKLALSGLSEGECADYVRRRMAAQGASDLWTDEAMQQLATAIPAPRSPLTIHAAARDAIVAAYSLGLPSVTAEAVEMITGRYASRRQMLMSAGITYAELAKVAGVSEATAWRAVSATASAVSEENRRKVDEAAAMLLQEKGVLA